MCQSVLRGWYCTDVQLRCIVTLPPQNGIKNCLKMGPLRSQPKLNSLPPDDAPEIEMSLKKRIF